jgi:putative heme iron utilization protein
VCHDAGPRAYWLARHPYARLYAGFSDFSLWRVVAESAAFVGGFALASTLAAQDMAPPPPAVTALQAAQMELIAHCNTSLAEALNRLAHARGAAGPWRMLGVDADGFDLVQDEAVLRVAFAAPVADGPAAKAALLHLLEAARRHF